MSQDGNDMDTNDFAVELIRSIFNQVNEKYPEQFPALTQHDVLKRVVNAIRKEIESIKSERERVLRKMEESISSSLRRWWD